MSIEGSPSPTEGLVSRTTALLPAPFIFVVHIQTNDKTRPWVLHVNGGPMKTYKRIRILVPTETVNEGGDCDCAHWYLVGEGHSYMDNGDEAVII